LRADLEWPKAPSLDDAVQGARALIQKSLSLTTREDARTLAEKFLYEARKGGVVIGMKC
jgi:hypothetical protein